MLETKNLTYVTFDLHKEVGHTKFENLSKLNEMTDKSLKSYGCFYKSPNSHDPTGAQLGVIRTNCKDNLDRTNLVQSLYAKQVCQKQLEKIAVPFANMIPSEKTAFESAVQMAWAENGDAISTQYAGTSAMRTVYLKTGKHGLYGMFVDATNSIRRYYINNFQDGQNQDALDIFFSKYPLPRQYAIDWKAQQVKKGMKTTLSIIFAFIFKLLQPPGATGITLLFCMIWMALVYLVWTILRLDTRRIVSLPVLRTNNVKPQASMPTTSSSPNIDKEKND